MKLAHLHISFKDLPASQRWMKEILGKEPIYQNPGMAVFSFGEISLVFDRGEEDSSLVLALGSANCEGDFSLLKSRGARITELPTDQPWGVRTAYFQGPGKLVLEIEQAL